MKIDIQIILIINSLMLGIVAMCFFLAIKVLFNIEYLLYKIRRDLYSHNSSKTSINCIDAVGFIKGD
jgi:hypothetical protein